MRVRPMIAALLPVVLAGCGLMKSTPSTIFDLETVPAPAAKSVAGAPVGIDTVELPPGLDRREIVVRQADHKLEIRGRQQWSATLAPLVLHTLAFDLASRLPEGQVVLPGQPKPDAPMRAIDLAFGELAAGPDKAVTLDVRWTLRENGRPAETTHETIRVPLNSLDSGEIAAATSQALATLADRIAARL